MAMQKIKNGDQVTIIAGKCKGQNGKVIKVLSKTSRVLVEGVNLIKKHLRGNPQKNQEGGIIEREATMHISNVALLNPATQKADRVGIKQLNDGRKVRYFKSNNEIIEE
jgi:large subunit ribosomal protein L24